MVRFPPGTGGGEGVAYRQRGTGLLIPSPTDASGRPLPTRTTPATGDERAQVIPLLEALHIRTGQRRRPRTWFKVLAAEKGDDANDLRHRLRKRAIRPQMPHRVWQTNQPRGAPHEQDVPRCQAQRTCAWFRRHSRRWVVRWARLAACFNAFLVIAMSHI
jgi:hypothetical protein